MTYAERLRAHVCRCGPGDRAGLMAFRRRMFGEDSRQADPAHVAWLFDRNPCCADQPDLWVFGDGATVAGHQAGIAVDLQVGDRMWPASWAVDLMVAPEWRLRGVGPVLAQAHAAAQPISLALWLSSGAYALYRRAGWTDLGALVAYVWPLSIRRLQDELGAQPWWRFLTPIGQPAISALRAAVTATAAAGGTRFAAIDAFDERADAIWRLAAPCYPILTRRDLAILRWRFDQTRPARSLRRFYLMRGDRALGYAVLSVDAWKAGRIATLIDYLVEPRHLMALFGHCLAVAQDEGASALVCKTLNPAAAWRLPCMGFLPRPAAVFPGTRLMAKVESDEPGLAARIAAPRNWLVTMADSDVWLDHPAVRRRAVLTAAEAVR